MRRMEGVKKAYEHMSDVCDIFKKTAFIWWYRFYVVIVIDIYALAIKYI